MDPTRSNSRPNAQPEDLNCSASDNKEGTTGTNNAPAAREQCVERYLGSRWDNVKVDSTKDKFPVLLLVIQIHE